MEGTGLGSDPASEPDDALRRGASARRVHAVRADSALRERHLAGRTRLADPGRPRAGVAPARADQPHAEPVADVYAFKAAHQSSFNGRMQKTDPGAFLRGAGNDGIEPLPDP